MRLPEPYRHTVLLRYTEDLTPREIARALGRPVDTVKTIYYRNTETLRKKLGMSSR